MDNDQPAHMWRYWRDKKGRHEALRDYYPGLLKSDPVIAAWDAQIRALEAAIDDRFERLAESEPAE
jgi:hypothetical protein